MCSDQISLKNPKLLLTTVLGMNDTKREQFLEFLDGLLPDGHMFKMENAGKGYRPKFELVEKEEQKT